MKSFFKRILLGLAVILLSISSIYSVVMSVLVFTEIISAKGFLVIGFLLISIICMFIGIYLIYLLGLLLDNYCQYIKKQEEERK